MGQAKVCLTNYHNKLETFACTTTDLNGFYALHAVIGTQEMVKISYKNHTFNKIAHDDDTSLVETHIPHAAPTTASSCKTLALSLSLTLGGGGYPFEADTVTKGCYAYSSGTWAGMAFFGSGGTAAQMQSTLTLPQYGPQSAKKKKNKGLSTLQKSA